LLRDGSLRSVVTRDVGFDELPAALEGLADRSVIGKTVVVVS
jgi:NADPH:quinone reductase-like Zn-dependent oxidoreductase